MLNCELCGAQENDERYGCLFIHFICYYVICQTYAVEVIRRAYTVGPAKTKSVRLCLANNLFIFRLICHMLLTFTEDFQHFSGGT